MDYPRNEVGGLNISHIFIKCILFFLDSLLQQTKHRNCVLIVENKNLKNKIMNMEYEMRGVREALRAEERKFILLNEKLKAKMVM